MDKKTKKRIIQRLLTGGICFWSLIIVITLAVNVYSQDLKIKAQAQKPDISSFDIKKVKEIYEVKCALCHGFSGEGNGPAANYLFPKPRDFVLGVYKFRTTESGELPTDEDLFKVIKKGVPDTEMPGWYFLGDDEIRHLVDFIKTFSEDFAEEEKPQPIKVGKGIPITPESIKTGKEVYNKVKCWECHGKEGLGDGPKSDELKDDLENKIIPNNLTFKWTYKVGSTPRDIYITFSTGLNGTPMPSYIDSLSEKERWHLANYVSSLVNKESVK